LVRDTDAHPRKATRKLWEHFWAKGVVFSDQGGRGVIRGGGEGPLSAKLASGSKAGAGKGARGNWTGRNRQWEEERK